MNITTTLYEIYTSALNSTPKDGNDSIDKILNPNFYGSSVIFKILFLCVITFIFIPKSRNGLFWILTFAFFPQIAKLPLTGQC